MPVRPVLQRSLFSPFVVVIAIGTDTHLTCCSLHLVGITQDLLHQFFQILRLVHGRQEVAELVSGRWVTWPS